MVPRMDIIKLNGGNMKKIYSIKERIIYLLLIVVLGLFQLTLLLNYSDNLTIVIIAYACVIFIVLALLKLISFPYHIIVRNNRMKVYDFPLLATNKFYNKKRSLILWNSEIDTNEVKGVDKAYAIQAGRELRVVVKPEEVDDLMSYQIARSIKEKIESEMQYPGTIKITVVRETRAQEEAK